MRSRVELQSTDIEEITGAMAVDEEKGRLMLQRASIKKKVTSLDKRRC